jgi:hypothetical protein
VLQLGSCCAGAAEPLHHRVRKRYSPARFSKSSEAELIQ